MRGQKGFIGAITLTVLGLTASAWGQGPTLTITPDGTCYQTRDTVTVAIELSDATTTIVAG